MLIDWDAFEECLYIARVLTGMSSVEEADYQDAVTRQKERYPELETEEFLQFSQQFSQAHHAQEFGLVTALHSRFPSIVREFVGEICPMHWSEVVKESNRIMTNRLRNDPDMSDGDAFDSERHVRCWLEFPSNAPHVPVLAKWAREEALNLPLPKIVRDQLDGQIVGEPLRIYYLQRSCLVASIEIDQEGGHVRPYGTLIESSDNICDLWLIEAKYFDFER